MYGPRQTDSVSLITFSSYLSRLYFAICLNFMQAINQFSKYQYRTNFEYFFGLNNYMSNSSEPSEQSQPQVESVTVQNEETPPEKEAVPSALTSSELAL